MKIVLYYIIFFIFFLFIPTWCFTQGGIWVWVKGSAKAGAKPVYGVQGVPDINNNPGGLWLSANWIDKDGNFWFFGGLCDTAYPNFDEIGTSDLWKYEPDNNMWTWMKGPGILRAAAVYGTQSVASPLNNPSGWGWGYSCWADQNNNLWLYGGYNSEEGFNELWRYNITSNEWTWVSGTLDQGALAGFTVYGNLQQASSSNSPGARFGCTASWVDDENNLWLFGGSGSQINYDTNEMYSDMWMYNIAINQWIWMSGPPGPGNLGSYGTKGVESASNLPPPRDGSSFWKDEYGNFYLYGGENPYVKNTVNTTYYSDVWKYNPHTNNWTWVAGDSGLSSIGNYQQYCTTGNNEPAARCYTAGAKTMACSAITYVLGGARDSLFQFGPYSNGLIGGNGGNDLWTFNTETMKWKWISGAHYLNNLGNYGIQGIAATTNQIPARYDQCQWVDTAGVLWVFGGVGFDTVAGAQPDYSPCCEIQTKNDLWKFIPDSTCVPLPNHTQVAYQLSPSTICKGDSARLSVTGLSDMQVFSSGVAIPNANDTAVLFPDTSTAYMITGIKSCTWRDTVWVTVNVTQPVAQFQLTPSVTTITKPETHISNQSTGFSFYNWLLNGTAISLPTDTDFIFADTGTYCFNLVVVDTNNCSDTAEHCITVFGDIGIYIPNAFSPDGYSANQHFTIFSKNPLSAYAIKIFNRWGEMVYESHNLSEVNDTNAGWDGTYKGKLQEPGVFVYEVSGKDESGNPFSKKGSVTLIR